MQKWPGAELRSWKWPPASLFFSQRDLAFLLSYPWQAEGRPEALGLRLLHKVGPGLTLVKTELKENGGGVPWSLLEKSHTRVGFTIWVVVAELLAHGRSVWSPHCFV